MVARRQTPMGALLAGATVADDLAAQPGPGRGLTDQFDENIVATIVAEDSGDGRSERGDELCDDPGRIISCEHLLAHAEGDRGRGRSDRRSAASPSSGRDADKPDVYRT